MFASSRPGAPREAKIIDMDAIDRKILALLQANGRMAFTELAAEVQLSVSRCQRRVRDLRADGVIRDYRGVIDAKKVGLGFEVIAFATLAHPDAIHDFDLAVEAVPEIVEAQRLFGEPDYFIRIVAADREAYQRLYDERLSKLPGLRSLNSTIVMKEVVAARGLPLDHGR